MKVCLVPLPHSPSLLAFLSQLERISSLGCQNPESPTALPERLTLSELSAPSPHPINYATSGGINIAYSVFGKGNPTLIVTPGIISNLHVSSNLPPIKDSMDGLARFAKIINFDKRGQGLSDPTSSVATMEDRVSDIECVADASGSDSFFLMGISEGGPMSIKYAVENPHRVRGLILFGTTPKFSRSDDFPMGFSNKTLMGLPNHGAKETAGISCSPVLAQKQLMMRLIAGSKITCRQKIDDPDCRIHEDARCKAVTFKNYMPHSNCALYWRSRTN